MRFQQCTAQLNTRLLARPHSFYHLITPAIMASQQASTSTTKVSSEDIISQKVSTIRIGNINVDRGTNEADLTFLASPATD